MLNAGFITFQRIKKGGGGRIINRKGGMILIQTFFFHVKYFR